MFHAFDEASVPSRPSSMSRRDWMALLSRAPREMLESALASRGLPSAQPANWLRRPETGLMMVQGRVGGSGERFNLGEITVTRCALRLPTAKGTVGVAYVLGRSHRQAELAATADALLQDPDEHTALERSLLQPVQRYLAALAAERQARAQTTRVDFLTVAREAGDGEDDDA